MQRAEIEAKTEISDSNLPQPDAHQTQALSDSISVFNIQLAKIQEADQTFEKIKTEVEKEYKDNSKKHQKNQSQFDQKAADLKRAQELNKALQDDEAKL